MQKIHLKFFTVLLLFNLSGCGYNAFQSLDEEAKASWSEVLNQYQRRADLVPSLVNLVKGYAAHQKGVLTQIADARSKVGSIQVTAEVLDDPEAFVKFQAAQMQLSLALSRLLAVSENYPNLKVDQCFRDLQAQLEGT
jgi:LemA protein